MRFEREPGGNSLAQIDIVYDGPNNESELNELRQRASQHAEQKDLTEDELRVIEKFVEDHINSISPENQPEVVLPETRCRVLVRENELEEIYGHGLWAQSHVIYRRLEELVDESFLVKYPGAKAAMVFSVNH